MHCAQRCGTSTPGNGMKTRTLEASGHIHPSCSILHANSQRLQPEQWDGSRAIQIGFGNLIHRNYIYRVTVMNKIVGRGLHVPGGKEGDKVEALVELLVLDIVGQRC